MNSQITSSLWEAVGHPKMISQKASFQFLYEDISFVTKRFNALRNSPLQIPRKQCKQTAQWKEQWNSLCWFQISQSSFSESFFLVFLWGYFRCHPRPQCSQISLWSFHENSVRKLLHEKKSVSLRDEYTHHKELSQKASF